MKMSRTVPVNETDWKSSVPSRSCPAVTAFGGGGASRPRTLNARQLGYTRLRLSVSVCPVTRIRSPADTDAPGRGVTSYSPMAPVPSAIVMNPPGVRGLGG